MYKRTILALIAGVIFSHTAYGADSNNSLPGEPVYYRLKGEVKDPNKPKAVEKLEAEAMQLITSKQYKAAYEKYDQAISKYPNNPGALFNRAFCSQVLGDIDKAAADYKKAGSLSPKHKLLADKQLGEMYLARGRSRIDAQDFRGAADDLKASAEYGGTKPRALSELAYIAMLNRDFPACIDMATQSSQLDSRFSDPLVTMGACYYYSGNPKAAISASTRALAIDPKLAGAYMNRMAAHVALKECAEAKQDAASIAAINPDFAQHTDNILAPCGKP